ncbi:hypothetical protein [Streptomyces sp. NPDC029526]|uniref:hypothetical protein n=1 Tax=Streptomyces sp. NPDC029526 TaxID=3155728 RepID=UPI0034072F09
MNTERPDNDDAGAEARAAGNARDTGGAPAGGVGDDGNAAARGREQRERAEQPEPGARGGGGESAERPGAVDGGGATDVGSGAGQSGDASGGAGGLGEPGGTGGSEEGPARSGDTEDPEGSGSSGDGPEDARAEGAPDAGAPDDHAPDDGGRDRDRDRDRDGEPGTAGSASAEDTPAADAEKPGGNGSAGASPSRPAGSPEPSGSADSPSSPGSTKSPDSLDSPESSEPSRFPDSPESSEPSRSSDSVGSPGGSDGSGDASRADDPDGKGHRTGAARRTPVLIASVAAAVLLVGGGGAYLATGLAGGSGSGADTTPGANGDPTPPPLALDGYAEGGVPGIAPGEPNPYGAVYRADGPLPKGPGSAPVYRTPGPVTQEQVSGLAKALGVEGRPVAEGGSWRIGGKDGSGPVLRVDQKAPGAWTFSRNALSTDNCKGATCKVPPADAPPVSEEAAEKAALPLLKALGQDTAKLDASRAVGTDRTVNAAPEVGGLPTHGWDTVVTVGSDGAVGGAQGRLLKPAKSDTYPVVGAERALKLMNAAPGADRRGGIGGCATPAPLDEGGENGGVPCQETSAVPPKDEGGGTDGKETLTVDRAVFGLASHSVDGQPALVPSWLFEVRTPGVRETSTVTYPAVDPEYLASATRSGEGSAAPSGPGDEPTSAPAERPVDVEGYTAEGDELTVTFTGGVCADYTTTARESGGKVTVTVTEKTRPGEVCILIAKQYQQTVRLDAPLGDREVVDRDGDAVPLHKDGARLPAPSGERS